MNLDLILTNLLSPPILFFFLGMGATLLRSDLRIPEPLPRLFALYLLWAIGFKGGVALRESGLDIGVLGPLGAAIVLSAATPIALVPILRRMFSMPDACALGAAYGSVSVVTFITAMNFLDAQGLEAGGHLVAALALMESPAIIVGVLLYRRTAKSIEPIGAAELMRETLASGPVYLLMGSLLVGTLTGPEGYEPLKAFTQDIFHGVLVLFLLESGMTAARRLPELRAVGVQAVAVSLIVPLLSAALFLGVARLLMMPPEDAFLFVILGASASYIAAPAAARLAIPEANQSLMLPMSLGITFPFNIAVGIPLYLAAVRLLWPAG